MSSLILRTAIRYLFPIIVLFSIFLLLRGHDEPGGGFIGGLLGATAFALFAIGYSVETSRRMLRFELHQLMGVGLLMATLSGVVGLILGEPFLSSAWIEIPIPGRPEPFKLATYLFFDIGVYLVVLSITLMIVYALAEE